jgi:hypothetical protein
MRIRLMGSAALLIAGWASAGAALAVVSAADLQECAPPSAAPIHTPAVPGATPVPATSVRQALLPDESADHTLCDTILLSGGEFVGDQASLTVFEAIRRAELDASGASQYAFLVEIEGLDPETLPYNSLDFALFDDQNFEYQAIDGGEQPALNYGDLPHGRRVKGWLTFIGPAESEYLELEYAPILALEPAYVRVLLP